MASVAGPRPHALSTRPVCRPGSGGPAVRCPAVWCPVRPASSPSGVRPSGVQCVQCPARPLSGHLVSTRPASSRLLSASVRPDASVSSHLKRWRWGPGPGGGQPSPPGRVESRWAVTPQSGSIEGRAGPGTRAMLPGSRRWSVGSVADPGQGCGRAAAAALDRWRTRQARPACAAPVAGGGAVAREQAAARWPQRPRGCRPRAGCTTTVRGGRGGCRPGGRARRGRWACRRG
jgi:hypothetical protein